MADVIVNLRIKGDGTAEVVKLSGGLKDLADQEKKAHAALSELEEKMHGLAEGAVEGNLSVAKLAGAVGAGALAAKTLEKGFQMAGEAIKGSIEFISEAVEKTAAYGLATQRVSAATGLSTKAAQE